jgi:tRNA(Ile)-lysidine synthase
MLSRVRAFIAQEALLKRGDRVVVAVSGGADSSCLLDVLYRMRDDFALDVHLAHFDHRLRAESASDAEFVARRARQLNLPIHAGAWDGPKPSSGVEAAAHTARYAFLDDVAAHVGAQRIAFGHTATDNIETVLMHLLRGAGLRGLLGLAPQRGKAIRPLLTITADETHAWCRDHAIDWREDLTNALPPARRNQLRQSVLPLLMGINPSLGRAITRSTESLRLDYDVLTSLAEASLPQAIEQTAPGMWHIDRAAFKALAPAIRRHMLQALFDHALPAEDAGDATHLRAAERLICAGTTGKGLPLPGEAYLETSYATAILTRDRLAPGYWEAALLDVPGSVAPRGAGWRLDARVMRASEAVSSPSTCVALLNPNALTLPLLVRARRPGDTVILDADGHRRKLQDLFVNAKIPRERRDVTPVVLSGSDIVWVGGMRAAFAARCDRRTATSPNNQVVQLTWTCMPGSKGNE